MAKPDLSNYKTLSRIVILTFFQCPKTFYKIRLEFKEILHPSFKNKYSNAFPCCAKKVRFVGPFLEHIVSMPLSYLVSRNDISPITIRYALNKISIP